MTQAIARFHPFSEGPLISVNWVKGMSIADVVKASEAPDWFWEHGEVVISRNGHSKLYKPESWRITKPKSDCFLELRVTIHGGKVGRIAMILASVALSVALPGIGSAISAHLVTLGLGTTAASVLGGLGASALGIGAIWALNALTPAPKLPDISTGQRDLVEAGISGNALTPGEYVAGVLGRIRVSPQIIAPSYITLEGDDLFTHALLGVANDCLVEDVMINGIKAADIPDLQMSILPGDGSSPDSFLSLKTVVHGSSALLPNFALENEQPAYDNLKDQVTPLNSVSKRIPFRKRAEATECVIRLLFEAGIIKSDGTGCAVPIRIFLRRKGDVSWRSLPTFHIKDTKASGPFRREIKLTWSTMPPGAHFGLNTALDVYYACYRTAIGESFEFTSDSYFAQSTYPNAVPVMADYTNGSVTVSASSEYGSSTTAWMAFDGAVYNTGWWPALNSLPAWIKVDHGAGNTKTIQSMVVSRDSTGTAPTFMATGYLDGSNDGTTWTRIHDCTVKSTNSFNEQVTLIAPFRYHRLTVTSNNGAASQELRIGQIILSEEPVHTQYYPGSDPNSTVNRYLARNVSLNYTGATVYLDPASWPVGEYDIQVQRGWAYQHTSLLLNTGVDYSYSGNTTYAHFFDPRLLSGYWIVTEGQKAIQSKTTVETFTSIYPSRPIRADVEAGLTRIAIRVPNLKVDSVSAIYTSKFRLYNGTVWDALPSPTRNPAAMYRDILLMSKHNAEPLPGEVLDEASLETFYTWCASNNYTCDALIHNRSVEEVLQLLAATARSSIRRADMWGLVIDSNRTASPIEILLTPETSRDLGAIKAFDRIPHGLRVSYLDETDDWKQKEVNIYRAGYDSTNATDIEAMTFDGITAEANVIKRATYLLNQMLYRNIKYIREVGEEGRLYTRGMLCGIADETIHRHSYYGLVKSFTLDGSNNVTGVNLYGTVELSQSAEAISNTEGALGTFGCVLRQTDGVCITRQVVEQGDTAVITFTTHAGPVTNFDIDHPVAIGPLSMEIVRTILHAKENRGDGTWSLTLLPEAPQVYQEV